VKQYVWVAGEALIDLVPNEKHAYPVVGGGPANTCKALAQLGVPVSFIGGISTDKFGTLIENEFNLVDLSRSHWSNLPTAIAKVSLDESGSASYEFTLEQTATFDFREVWLPKGSPDVLYVGSLASIVEPGASELFNWTRRLDTPVIFDPNVRPNVMSNLSKYKAAIERWMAISTIIKLSKEDLDWLGYANPQDLLSFGASLVVVTNGGNGLAGYTLSDSISTPAVAVEVVDTVGAGDTVGAVLVEGLLRYGLQILINDRLIEVLNRAAKAAAITCTRAGAKPPTLSELEA